MKYNTFVRLDDDRAGFQVRVSWKDQRTLEIFIRGSSLTRVCINDKPTHHFVDQRDLEIEVPKDLIEELFDVSASRDQWSQSGMRLYELINEAQRRDFSRNMG